MLSNSSFKNSYDVTSRYVPDLLRLYSKVWWTKGRAHDGTKVTKMLETSSLTVGAFRSAAKEKASNENNDVDKNGKERDELVGFCRVLTDQVFKAVIFDLIVAEDCRGNGLGGQLLNAVLASPIVRNVEHVELYCLPEMLEYYCGRWGFSKLSGDGKQGLQYLRLCRHDDKILY